MDTQQLKKRYRRLDQFILILMIVALPMYGMIYLYHSSGTGTWDIPRFPEWMNQLLIFAGFLLLIAQVLLFRKRMSTIVKSQELSIKLKIYADAIKQKYILLFIVTLLCAGGLLLFESAFYNLIFALTLLFFSLGKPNPNRMNKLLKLNDEDKELVRLATRPD